MNVIGPRRLFRIPVFIAASLTLAITAIGWIGSETWPFELIDNFPVQLLVVGTVCTALAALLRGRVTLVIAVLCVAGNVGPVASSLLADPMNSRRGSAEITVGHLNAQTRSIDADALGRFLHSTRPAVFIVLDPAQRDIPPLTRVAPGYRVHRTGSRISVNPGFVRTVVLSRVPIDAVRHPLEAGFGRSAVEFSIAGETPISVVAFGTDSPTTPARTDRRNMALTAAAQWSRAHSARRIVMGDFNTTPWSDRFHALLRNGRLSDSLVGFGIQASWPESNLLIRIPIDHALLGPGLAATDRGTGPSFGSQHRSLHLTVASRR